MDSYVKVLPWTDPTQAERLLNVNPLAAMHLRSEYILPVLLCFASAQDSETPKHGEGEEGTSMGPVAFLWPADRTWNAANDNTGPCGSPNGPSNRTTFPLTQGSVALSVADEAWHVAFRVAFGESMSGYMRRQFWSGSD